jgi:hypothetical protein
MERRVTSHTEEEEMNQRRHLLTLARKGDQESIDMLFEFYQVKVFSGDELKKKKLPSFPVSKPGNASRKGKVKPAKVKEKTPKVSLSVSKAKAKKGKTDEIQSAPKGSSKVPTKTATVKSHAPKVKKTTKTSLKKKPAVKKITPPKKKTSGEKSKEKAPGSAKKPKIAKKK